MRKSEALIFYSCFSYSVVLSMTSILIPLYGYSIGLSPLQLGMLISAPGVFQILLRLFGGVIADQFGERFVLTFSYTTIMAGSLAFLLSVTGLGSFGTLFVAQLIMGASRAVFWPASQSYASRINPQGVNKNLSKLSSFISSGKFTGYVIGGSIAAVFGFVVSFIVCSVLGLVAILCNMLMPDIPRKVTRVKIWRMLEPIPTLLRNKALYLAGISAFIAALPEALLSSFFATYLSDLGYNASVIGILVSLRSVGMILIGIVFAVFIERLGRKWVFAISLIGTGFMIVSSTFYDAFWYFALVFLTIGITSGMANIQYQVTVSENSPPERRGLAMATSGLAWGLAFLIVPTLFGAMVSWWGLIPSFWISGLSIVLIGLFTPVFFRLLLNSKEEITSLHPEQRGALTK